MADPTPGDDTGVGSDREYPGIPRWVKVSGIIVIVLVLLVIGLMFITGHEGERGPGQHGPGGEPAGQIEQEAPRDQARGNHAPPEGGRRLS